MISSILQPLFLRKIILFTSQISLFFLCFWCIYMCETLFQTWQTLLLLPKDIIWDSMNLVSTEALFLIGVRYPIADYTHCMIDIINTVYELYQGHIFTDVMNNVKTALFLFHFLMLWWILLSSVLLTQSFMISVSNEIISLKTID